MEKKYTKEREGDLRDTEWVRYREGEEFDPAVMEGDRRVQRPKLFVATSSSSQHTVLHEPQSPPLPIRKSKHSSMRCVRSGSNLKSLVEEQEPPSPTAGGQGERRIRAGIRRKIILYMVPCLLIFFSDCPRVTCCTNFNGKVYNTYLKTRNSTRISVIRLVFASGKVYPRYVL
jgi:hypothetical protein